MNYLEKAMDLDIHLVSKHPVCKKIPEHLFQKISESLKIRNVARSKETLNLVIINLLISFLTDTPIKYSRNRNNYLSHKRYGKLHIKYKRLIPIVDVLEKLGYVHQRIGFFDRITHKCHILEANGESYRLRQAKKRSRQRSPPKQNLNQK